MNQISFELSKQVGLLDVSDTERTSYSTMAYTLMPTIERQSWVKYALQAAFLFTLCDSAIEFTYDTGLVAVLCFSFGSLISSLFYFAYQSHRQRTSGYPGWVSWNFVQDTKINWGNFIGFAAFCLTLLLSLNFTILAYYQSGLAQLNVDFIPIVWSLHPIFLATADFGLFDQRLTILHAFGVLGIVASLAFISLSELIDDEGKTIAILPEDQVKVPTSAYITVLLAFLLPVLFTISVMLLKHLTQFRGFDSKTLSFGANLVVSMIMIVAAILFWSP